MKLIRTVKEWANPALKCVRVDHDYSDKHVQKQVVLLKPTLEEQTKGIVVVEAVRYRHICTRCSTANSQWNMLIKQRHHEYRMTEALAVDLDLDKFVVISTSEGEMS